MGALNNDINAAVAQVATDFGKAYVTNIKSALSAKDKIATGALYNSINYNVDINDVGVRLELQYNDYLQWIDLGRRPGTMPPVDAIEAWILARNVPIQANARRNAIGRFSKGFKIHQGRNGLGQYTSITAERRKLAWAIAMAIKKNGIKAVPILDDAQAKLYSPMQQAATEAVVKVAHNHLDSELERHARENGLFIQTTY